MTPFERLERRMEREAQGSLFDQVQVDGDWIAETSLRDLDAIERANGGRWQLCESFPGEVVIRDERLSSEKGVERCPIAAERPPSASESTESA